MIYTQHLANDFWYEFDNTFFWRLESAMDTAIGNSGDIDILYDKHRTNGTYPSGYIDELGEDKNRADSILFVAQNQFQIIIKYFQNDIQSQQKAFEDFGQGILYDSRSPRSKDRRIHMMDENRSGYRFWHIFIRTAVLLTKDISIDILHRWLDIDRHIGLASGIHLKQHPSQSNASGQDPKNPEIDPSVLKQLQDIWLKCTFSQLDDLFDSREEQLTSSC
jgi:hypothetical protein